MKKLHHQLSVIIHNQQNRHHFSCEGDIQPHDCPKGTFFEVKKEMKMMMLENKNHLTGKQDVWLLSSLCCLPWVRSALRWLRRWGELSYLLVIVCVCVCIHKCGIIMHWCHQSLAKMNALNALLIYKFRMKVGFLALCRHQIFNRCWATTALRAKMTILSTL